MSVPPEMQYAPALESIFVSLGVALIFGVGPQDHDSCNISWLTGWVGTVDGSISFSSSQYHLDAFTVTIQAACSGIHHFDTFKSLWAEKNVDPAATRSVSTVSIRRCSSRHLSLTTTIKTSTCGRQQGRSFDSSHTLQLSA